MGKPIKILTEDEYQEMDANYQGICIACGEIAEECEPDAEKYPCDACGRNKVYGIEEALCAGYVDIEDSDNENGEYESDEDNEESDTDSN